MEIPTLDFKYEDYELSKSTFIMTVKNHAMLIHLLRDKAKAEAEKNGTEFNEELRLLDLSIKEEMVKIFEKLPNS